MPDRSKTFEGAYTPHSKVAPVGQCVPRKITPVFLSSAQGRQSEERAFIEEHL